MFGIVTSRPINC